MRSPNPEPDKITLVLCAIGLLLAIVLANFISISLP